MTRSSTFAIWIIGFGVAKAISSQTLAMASAGWQARPEAPAPVLALLGFAALLAGEMLRRRTERRLTERTL